MGSVRESRDHEEEEVGLSRTGINKLIKDTISKRVANDTRDLIHLCCTEFIRVVGAEANRLCAQEQKKTIGNEHIFKGKARKISFSLTSLSRQMSG